MKKQEPFTQDEILYAISIVNSNWEKQTNEWNKQFDVLIDHIILLERKLKEMSCNVQCNQ